LFSGFTQVAIHADEHPGQANGLGGNNAIAPPHGNGDGIKIQGTLQFGQEAVNLFTLAAVGLVQEFKQTKREVVAFVGGFPIGEQIARSCPAIRGACRVLQSRVAKITCGLLRRRVIRRIIIRHYRNFLPSNFAAQTLVVPPRKWSHANAYEV
jgi:hypothetical protein